jgi:hypothetical protein
MPNNFGGSQFHPDYTGIAPRARSKNECVCAGVLYVRVGHFVEVEQLNGSVLRYGLKDEALPARVRRRFAKPRKK